MAPPDTAAPDQTVPSGAPWRRLARRLGFDLRPGEGSLVVVLFLAFLLIITFQYATKTVRQSTFIDALGAARLPWVYLAVALASYPFLRLYSRLADRTTRHGLIAAACGGIAATMVGFWWLYYFPWDWVRVVFYVWVSIVYVALVSQFWSFANHLLDPRQAKRLFGVIGAGGLLGAVVGGQTARLAAASVGTRGSLLVAAVILFAVAGLVLWVARRHRGTAAASAAALAPGERLERARGGLEVIRGSRHLQAITLILVLTVMVAQVVDLQFNWVVERATSTLEQRTAFFGNFFTVMGVSAFAFQMLFTARIHRVLGVGFALRVLPTTMGLGTVTLFAAAGAAPALLLPAAFLLKVGENGLRHSLDQATRELLFLPVPGALRLKAKAFIDVFVQRGAKGLIALLLLPVAFGVFSPVHAGWLSLALIPLWLAAAGWAYREYVSSFRAGLKRRTFDAVTPVDLTDARTLEILVESLGSPDARQVLHSLDILAANDRGRLVPPLLLYHDHPEVRLRTLEVVAKSQRRDAVPLVARCLADPEPEVRAIAARSLARLEARGLAELMGPHLRDPDPRVRAAAVTCLAEADLRADQEAAAKALEELLSDADAGARREGAKSLAALPEPRFQPELMQLLYDRDPTVVREGVAAVHRRLLRDGPAPLYVPTLVSLLRNRRLKHSAREALVAVGPAAVPLLGRFLEDPQEDLWVRRALPKTLARIGGADAARVLLDALERRDDAFLVRKLVEALPALPESDRQRLPRGRIAEQLRREAEAWALAFTRLVSLGLEQRGTLQGPSVQWLATDPGPELVEQLLAERLEQHLGNLFGLLAVHHPAAPMRGAHLSLVSGQPGLRSHALEYLDNTLAGEERRWVFAVIDDCPVDEKLRRLEKLFGARPLGRVRTLGGAIEGGSANGVEARDLAVLALYAAHAWGLRELLGPIRDLAREARDPLLSETASWVERRLSGRGARD